MSSTVIVIIVAVVVLLALAVVVGVVLNRKRRIDLSAKPQVEEEKPKGGYQAGGGINLASGGQKAPVLDRPGTVPAEPALIDEIIPPADDARMAACRAP